MAAAEQLTQLKAQFEAVKDARDSADGAMGVLLDMYQVLMDGCKTFEHGTLQDHIASSNVSRPHPSMPASPPTTTGTDDESWPKSKNITTLQEYLGSKSDDPWFQQPQYPSPAEFAVGSLSLERQQQGSSSPTQQKFVAVLIDGNGYLSPESFISQSKGGGVDYYRAFKRAICIALAGVTTQGCKLVVRIYADFAKLVGQYPPGTRDPRDRLSILRSFAAGFNSMDSAFDFVDTGSEPNMVLSKIRDNLELYGTHSSCEHVLLGICHKTSYLPLLQSFKQKRQFCSLIKSDAISQPQYSSLGFTVVDMSKVLLPRAGPGPTINVPPTQQQSSTPLGSRTQKAFAEVGGMRSDVMGSPQNQDMNPTIPVNAKGQRIDPPTNMVFSPSDGNRFHAYGQICHSFHFGQCQNATCPHDHTPLDDAMMTMLTKLAKFRPCSRGSSCRYTACFKGHHCQRKNCDGTGCKFGPEFHNMDLNITGAVSGTRLAQQPISSASHTWTAAAKTSASSAAIVVGSNSISAPSASIQSRQVSASWSNASPSRNLNDVPPVARPTDKQPDVERSVSSPHLSSSVPAAHPGGSMRTIQSPDNTKHKLSEDSSNSSGKDVSTALPYLNPDVARPFDTTAAWDDFDLLDLDFEERVESSAISALASLTQAANVRNDSPASATHLLDGLAPHSSASSVAEEVANDKKLAQHDPFRFNSTQVVFTAPSASPGPVSTGSVAPKVNDSATSGGPKTWAQLFGHSPSGHHTVANAPRGGSLARPVDVVDEHLEVFGDIKDVVPATSPR